MLKESFEEILNGFIFSLQDIHLFTLATRMANEKQNTPFSSREEMEVALEKMQKKAERDSFSTIIDTLKTDFGLTPALLKEVQSLNILRIVITHRNSVVSKIATTTLMTVL